MTDKKKVLVFGAGVTGLATAWKLATSGIPVTLIEKTEVPGGLSGTIDWDGWRFDYGPHNFHSKDDQIIGFFQQFLGNELIEYKPKIQLRIFGKLVSYPLVGAEVLLVLRGLKMAQAAGDFLLARTKACLFGIPDTDFVDEWIIRRFGRVLYNTYFGPYLSRVWKTDPHRLSKMVGEQKIPVMSIRNYIRRELLMKKVVNPDDLASLKNFLVRRGMGSVSERFLQDLNKMPHFRFLKNEEVKEIHLDQGKVISIRTGTEQIDASSALIVSTIPLTTLLGSMTEAPEGIRRKAESLEYCSERFLFVRTRKPFISGNNWSYFSDDKYCFNRVSEFAYDQFGMVPEKGFSSLTFELPSNDTDWAWKVSDRELMEHIQPLFNEVFPLSMSDIIDYRSAFQKHAYPRFIVGYEKTLKEVFGYLKSLANVYSIGRQGLFCYLNVDGCTKIGFELADAILENKPHSENLQYLLQKYHNIDLG